MQSLRFKSQYKMYMGVGGEGFCHIRGPEFNPSEAMEKN